MYIDIYVYEHVNIEAQSPELPPEDRAPKRRLAVGFREDRDGLPVLGWSLNGSLRGPTCGSS